MYNEAINLLKNAKNFKILGKNLYKVIIDSTNRYKEKDWLRWDKPLTKEQKNKVKKAVKKLQLKKIKTSQIKGEDVYESIAFQTSPSAASKALLEQGIPGIKYPAGTLSGGNKSGVFNYVVFDPKDITIEKHIRLQTSEDQKDTDKKIWDKTKQNILYSRENKRPWPKDFPNAILHTSLKKMKSDPDYIKAKAGDIESARKLVTRLIKPKKVLELFKKFSNAVVVAPHAEESTGRNAIPRVIAEAYGDAGFEVNDDIIQTNIPKRTKKSGFLRLAVRPTFDGYIEPGREYILIDDAIGQGGTLSELRHYIENKGGKVVSISALTSGIYGAKISIKPETIKKIINKFGRQKTEDFLNEFNIAGKLEALTEKEGQKIVRQPSINSLRTSIIKEAREANIPSSAWEVQTLVPERDKVTDESDKLASSSIAITKKY